MNKILRRTANALTKKISMEEISIMKRNYNTMKTEDKQSVDEKIECTCDRGRFIKEQVDHIHSTVVNSIVGFILYACIFIIPFFVLLYTFFFALIKSLFQ